MSKETLLLQEYGFGGKRVPDLTIEVEYRKAPYYDHDTTYAPDHRGKTLTAYDVYVDGTLTGRIRQTIASTDRNYNTIRVPGRGKIAWSWDRKHTAGPNRQDRTSNYPGLYRTSKRSAVGDMMGYGCATKVAS
jgi:hypothetical protein